MIFVYTQGYKITKILIKKINTTVNVFISILIVFFFFQLGLPGDCQLEFVNGGHGIKNPLAIDGQRQPAAITREDEKPPRVVSSKVKNLFLLHFSPFSITQLN